MRSSFFVTAASVALSFAALACGSTDTAPLTDAEAVASSTAEALHASPLGPTLPGDYRESNGGYPQFSLHANGSYVLDTGIRCITTPCPSGEAGNWNLYRSGRNYYVALENRRSVKWLRVDHTDGQPNELVGVSGVTGTFAQQIANPCMTVRCSAGFTCSPTGPVRCVPDNTCANTTQTCSGDQHCEDRKITCVRAPCPASAPACIDNACPPAGTIRCMPIVSDAAAPFCSYRSWIVEHCPGVTFAF